MIGKSAQARPTIQEIRTWPATVTVEQAATAFGVGRSHAYECVRTGTFPARTLKVGERIVVITGSILAALGEPVDSDGACDDVRQPQNTAGHSHANGSRLIGGQGVSGVQHGGSAA